MRAPLLGDVVAAARALRAVPSAERPALLCRLLEDADAADRHRRLHGRVYPTLGDGSLMSAALAQGGVREPSLDDAVYCRCLARVLLCLARRHDRAAALSS